MIRRTLAVAVKEFLQLRRDWRTALALLGMPLVLLLLYGYALSFDVKDVRLAVIDRDGTFASRTLREAFFQSRYFVPSYQGSDLRQLDSLFDAGVVQAAVVIAAGYGADLAAGRDVEVQLVLDGSDAQTAAVILGYARGVAGSLSPFLRAPGASGPVVARPLVRYNPDLVTSRFLVPGLVAFILMITSVIATALAVVREKERGTMESLRATPLLAVELLLGKTLPYLLLASAAAVGELLLAWALFAVPIRGSLAALALVTLLFLLGGLGWGVLISTLADTQQVAFQIGLLSSMLPTLLLSGFIFPISSMPRAIQIVTHVIPARYFIASLRGIVLKGAGPEVWGPHAAGLALFAAVVLALATVRTVRSL